MKKQNRDQSTIGWACVEVSVQVEYEGSLTLRASAGPIEGYDLFFERTVQKQEDLVDIFQEFLRQDRVKTNESDFFVLAVSYDLKNGSREYVGQTSYAVHPSKHKMSCRNNSSLVIIEDAWEQAGGTYIQWPYNVF